MEERQDKSALGWGKEEKKKETETKWWKVWDTKVLAAAVLFHRIHKVWNKYSVCLDIVSSPSINKIYHVINWTEITNWATWNSPSQSTVCPAQTHNSVCFVIAKAARLSYFRSPKLQSLWNNRCAEGNTHKNFLYFAQWTGAAGSYTIRILFLKTFQNNEQYFERLIGSK